MWLYVAIGIIIILLVYIFVLYNSFVRLENKVKEAFSTMDVYLKKRWELIPNLVEVVKGYAKHEEETILNVTKIRNNVYEDLSNEDKIRTNQKLNNEISKIMLLKESYPDLKASNNFIDLSQKLTKTEDDIANARKYYNAVVRMFNNKVQIFPNNLFAKLFGYKTKMMYEARKEERDSVDIKM